jgi:hypothetical protein
LSCFFEPQTVSSPGHGYGCEVIRTIYGAVRDQNWNTVEPEILVGRIATENDFFDSSLRLNALRPRSFPVEWDHRRKGWNALFRFAGKAKSTFKKRIGLCLLHPFANASEAVPVRGRTMLTEAEFPLFISPHQPFKGLGAILGTGFRSRLR